MRNRIGSPCAFWSSRTTATPPTIWSRRSARSAMSPMPRTDGEDGLAMALDGQYDVLIVDRMLPKRDGLSLIGTLRDKGIETPALILSALGQVDDRVKGLRAGGDDYLPKPYSFTELLARIEVLARRRGGAQRGNRAARRRSRTRPAVAPGAPRRGRDYAAAARIPPAGIPDEARRARWSPAPCCWRTCGITISTRKPM